MVEMMTPEDVARALKMSRSKIYELIASGEIPGIKIGRATRVATADLDAWVQRRREANARELVTVPSVTALRKRP